MNIRQILRNWFRPAAVVEKKKVKPPKITLPATIPAYIKDMATLGQNYGWRIIDWQKNIGMLSMWRDEVRLNIYTTTMTVATCLNHPTKGKTQLFRRRVTHEELEAIYKKPRVHTGKGYQKKGI